MYKYYFKIFNTKDRCIDSIVSLNKYQKNKIILISQIHRNSDIVLCLQSILATSPKGAFSHTNRRTSAIYYLCYN